MKVRVFYIFYFLLSISAFLVSAVNLNAQQPHLKLYNVNDGLPVSEAYSAYKDKYGYLWIGSPAGLSRFDGRQFVNYSLSEGLPSLTVVKIFQDSYDRLWVGTSAGVAQFKNNRFITYNTNDKLDNTYIFNFTETKDKRLWALTSRGVYEFTDSIWKKIFLYPGFENKACRNIIEADGGIYVNYASDIFFKNKEDKWTHIASKNEYGSMFNVMSLQNKQIWVSTINNIFIIHNYQLVPVFKNGLESKIFFSYIVDSKKRLWIAGKGFIKISKPGDWQHLNASINQNGYCYFISEDSSRNVWIGTTDGLLKVKDISYSIIDKNNAVPLDGIYNMIALPGNKMLFSSGKKSGLLMYENNFFKQIFPPRSAGNENYYQDPVDAFTFDDKNTLWMITRFRKLLHFDGETLTDFSGDLRFKTAENIYGMEYVRKRKQFFICADSTLLYGNLTKFSTFIPRNTGIPVVKPTRVLMLKNGLLLLYVDGKGVFCIDTADNLISLIKETGIDGSKKGIQLNICFYEDNEYNLWIAFPGLGLYEYGFSKNKLPFLKNHLTIKDGLQSNNILSLTSDRQKRLWLATNTGVDILQLNHAGNWEVFNFAKEEELGLNESVDEKIVSDAAGNIWLSSPNKIVEFDVANISLYKETPSIIIEKVSLAFKETDWSKLTDSLYSYYQLPYDPILNYKQNSLGISFNAIDLSTSNSNPEYSYKLLPLDTSWSIPAKIKFVSFAQLPEGKYQFMVRAKDMASGWSKPALFRFIISPPFWNRWWFKLVVIAITSFIIVSIIRLRISKIKQEASIKNQLKELEMKALKAQMNPHFIYNALNSIQSLIANDKKTEGIYYIGSFSRLLRQVLDNSENNIISLDKELETIGFYIQLETLRLDMQLQYKKNIPENVVTEFEKIPPLILQPFVENALWHGLSSKAGEKEIKITVSTTDDWLICEIADNGIGRVKAQEWKSQSVDIHLSKAIDITRKRLIDFNENDLVSPIEFFDLYDDNKNPSGTLVTVRIKRKSSLPSV